MTTSLRNAVMAHVATAVVGSFLVAGAAVVAHALAVQRRTTEDTADQVAMRLARRLEMERSLSLHGPAAGFSGGSEDEWTLRPGQCVAIRRGGGDAPRHECRGSEPAATALPSVFRALWPAAEPVERRVTVRGVEAAQVIVQPDATQAAAAAWDRGVPLLGLCAGTLAVAGALLSLLVRRSLRPLQALADALDRLARGRGTAALGRSGLREMDTLAERFEALSETLLRRTEERDALLRQLAEVQEAERGHLARELHDQLGQQLAAVQALAASIESSASPERPSVAREAARIQQLVTPMMGNLRSVLVQLRPPGLSEFGLARTLGHLVEEWDRSAPGTRFELEVADVGSPVPDAVAVHLFRAAQECLTNAVKHARAMRILVRLRRWTDAAGAGIELVVQDDGEGPPPAAERRPGLGLLGLRERMALLGGRLEQERLSPCGHRVRLSVPVEVTAHGSVA